MSVKKGPSGRRSVQIEIEVPGTPEEVWQAIATGRGISWLMPAEAETAAHQTPLWDAWFQKHFPMPTEPGKSE